MPKKTLITNGSPRLHGDTATLINELKKHLTGEVVEISAYRSKIAPCVDCRGCWKTAKCVVKDDMSIIYNDDFPISIILCFYTFNGFLYVLTVVVVSY